MFAERTPEQENEKSSPPTTTSKTTQDELDAGGAEEAPDAAPGAGKKEKKGGILGKLFGKKKEAGMEALLGGPGGGISAGGVDAGLDWQGTKLTQTPDNNSFS